MKDNGCIDIHVPVSYVIIVKIELPLLLFQGYKLINFILFSALQGAVFEPRQANLCLRAFRHDKF